MPRPSTSAAPALPAWADRSIETISQALRARGERLTRPRLAVLHTLLAGADDHLTAEDLIAAVHRDAPELASSSVYRALEWLESTGVAQHTHLGHSAATWHLVGDDRHHLVCERCGRVEHLPAEVLEDLRRSLASSYGFELQRSHFALSGTCRRCRVAANAPAASS